MMYLPIHYPSIHPLIFIHPSIILPSTHLSVILPSIHPSIQRYNHLFIYPSIHSSIQLVALPSIHLFIHPSIHHPKVLVIICPSFYPSIHHSSIHSSSLLSHPSILLSIHPCDHPSIPSSIQQGYNECLPCAKCRGKTEGDRAECMLALCCLKFSLKQ